MPSPRKSGVRIVSDHKLSKKVDESFDDLTEAYPFLYRIFSDRSLCGLDEDGFIAPSGEIQKQTAKKIQEEVAKEITWGMTGYIATSLSLTYILHEANRRQTEGEEKIGIAFIRAKDFLHGNAFLALNKLGLPEEDHGNLKARRFANLQQTILVEKIIPKTSIVHVISFEDLVNSLPKYFLRDGALDLDKTPRSQVSNASQRFWVNFKKGMQGKKGVSEMDARIAQGSRIAMELIIRPQLEEVDFLRTAQGGFNDIIEKTGAIDVAIEFAQFPCLDDEQMAINTHLSLHSAANKNKIKAALTYQMLLDGMDKLKID